jgi:hypothetical protein
VWLTNSGASFHITSHRYWFSMFEKYYGGIVYLGDNSTLNIVGHGRVLTRFPGGEVKGRNGVLHVLGLARNVLSVSKLNDVGVQLVFSNKVCKLVQGAMALAKGVRVGTLFSLDACTI